MDRVLEKAQDLAEAIRSSETFIQMKQCEQRMCLLMPVPLYTEMAERKLRHWKCFIRPVHRGMHALK